MKRPYTENDIVFKGDTLNAVISTYLESLDENSRQGVRNEMTKLLKKAEKEKKPAKSARQNVEAQFIPQFHEYLLIRRNEYNAANLLFVLFDLMVEHPEGEAEEIEKEVHAAIDSYIGVIEKQEGVNFLGQRENLKQLSKEMIHTMSMVDEEDFPEKELEELSEQIDKNYYEPIAMLLQNILIEIEKAPGA